MASWSFENFVASNGLLPVRLQAITWTSADLSWVGRLGTNFSGILIEIQAFAFAKKDLKMASTKWILMGELWDAYYMYEHSAEYDHV